MENYNDFLMISEEIELNRLSTELELILITNEKLMNEYSKTIAFDKVCQLFNLIDEFVDLRMRAVFHGNTEIWDQCELYIANAEYQMKELREIYM